MSLQNRLNKILHPILEKRVWRAYQKKVAFRLRQRTGLDNPVDEEITRKHLELYGRLGLPCSDKWLRLYSNLTGEVDYTYLPEDLYFCRVERVLNDCDRAGFEAEDKNLLSIYIPKKYLAKTYLRFIRGYFLDEDYQALSEEQTQEILHTNHGPLIGKEAVASLGGNSVSAFYFHDGGYYSSKGIQLTIDWIRSNSKSFILQEKIEQCDFGKQFNASSANTCRMTTLRCPWDGKIVVTKSAMRFGVKDVAVDNMAQGGVAVGLSAEGELGATAFSWEGMKAFKKHPSSGVVFEGKKHPYYHKMCDTIIGLAQKIPNFNLLSWDVIVDKNGDVKIIEVNLVGQGTDVHQFAFGSFFGKYTEPLIDWIAAHSQYDTFKHFRAFNY